MKNFSLWILMPFLFQGFSSAQETDFTVVPVQHHGRTPLVSCIVQDERGFLWLGTDQGLQRFDGFDFKTYVYEPDKPTSLVDNQILTLFATRAQLWIGMGGGGLNRLDLNRERITRISFSGAVPNETVRVISQDAAGMLWLGTDEGLFRMNPAQPGPLFERSRVDIPVDRVRALWAETEKIWVATDRDVLVVAPGGSILRHFSPNLFETSDDIPYRVNRLQLGSNQRIWLGTQDGLMFFHPLSEKMVPFPEKGAGESGIWSDPILALQTDSSGLLWVGSRRGLGVLDCGTGSWVNVRISGNQAMSEATLHVLSFCEDKYGTMWIGTSKGLFRHNPFSRRFDILNRIAGAEAETVVAALGEDDSGRLWVGGPRGLHYVDPFDQQNRFHPPVLPSGAEGGVYALLTGREGLLWVATRAGLGAYDPEKNAWSEPSERVLGVESPDSSKITCLAQDSEGFIWGGFSEGGLFRRESSGRYTRFKHDPKDPESLGHDEVTSLYTDHLGRLWVGTADDLNLRQTGRNAFRRFRGEPSLAAKLGLGGVLCIGQDSQNKIWIGLRVGGLSLLVDEATGRFRHIGALERESVFAMLADDMDFLWLGTSRGLARYHPERESLRFFGPREGIPFAGFSPGAGVLSNNGRLFFGGADGIIALFPNQIKTLPVQPRPVLTGFLLANQVSSPQQVPGEPRPEKMVDEIETLNLSSECRFFGFEFATPPLGGTENIRFAFRMDGYDETWIPAPAGSRRALYANLPAGEYRFQLKAGIDGGPWVEREPPTRVILSAPPVSRERYLFLGLFVLTAFAALAYGRRLNRIGSAVVASGETRRDADHTLPQQVDSLGTVSDKLEPNPVDSEPSSPVVFESEETPDKPVSGHESTAADPDQPHILIADDDPMNRLALVNHLSNQRYQISEAIDGVETMKIIEKTPDLDLVLLDIMMPGMSGYEVCRKVREIATLNDLPIIFLTARNWNRDVVRGFEAGANDYLTKPVNKSELLARVKTHIELLHINRHLELKVEQRTRELDRKNRLLDTQIQELVTLYNIVKTINKEFELNKVLQILLDQGMALFPLAQRASFLYLDRKTKQYIRLACHGFNPELPYLETLSTDPIRKLFLIPEHKIDEGIYRHDPLFQPSMEGLPIGPPKAWLIITTPFEEEFLGLLILENDSSGSAFEGADILKLANFREHAVAAVQRAAIFKDLAEAQDALVEAAHEAGMAETARNILHDLGNSLNSVSTTTQLIRGLVERPKANKLLHKIADRLGQQVSLIDYFRHNPQSATLPDVLAKVAGEWTAQLDKLTRESETQLTQLTTITRVLQKQHQLAGGESLKDIVDLDKIIRTTLQAETRQNREFMFRHVVSEEPLPFVRANKTRLRQTLLYLLKNAEEAILERDEGSGKITVKTGIEGDRVCLAVDDNGIGIAGDQLPKLCLQGYSTKAKGRGFGLHYAANTMKELSGSIEIISRGERTGTTVHLYFPVMNKCLKDPAL